MNILNREDLLTYNKKKKESSEKKTQTETRENSKGKIVEEPIQEKIFLTTTFRPNYSKLNKLVKKNWENLSQSHSTRPLQRMQLVSGYKRPKNLRDILVRSRTNFNPEDWIKKEEEGPKINTNICKDPTCDICPRLDRTGKIEVTSKLKKETKTNIFCKSSNVVYCIECKCCGKRYVGETYRDIKFRIKEHIGDIDHKRYDKSEVAYHFNRPDHNKHHDMKVYILDFIYEHPESKRGTKLRKSIEFSWIQRLKTLVPMGMNILESRYG